MPPIPANNDFLPTEKKEERISSKKEIDFLFTGGKSFAAFPLRVVYAEKKPASCRYSPTCSEYALQAIKKYEPFKGGRLAVKRIFRCHPWGREGFDPVL